MPTLEEIVEQGKKCSRELGLHGGLEGIFLKGFVESFEEGFQEGFEEETSKACEDASVST